MDTIKRLLARVFPKYVKYGDYRIQQVDGYGPEHYKTIVKALETGKPVYWSAGMSEPKELGDEEI